MVMVRMHFWFFNFFFLFSIVTVPGESWRIFGPVSFEVHEGIWENDKCLRGLRADFFCWEPPAHHQWSQRQPEWLQCPDHLQARHVAHIQVGCAISSKMETRTLKKSHLEAGNDGFLLFCSTIHCYSLRNITI